MSHPPPDIPALGSEQWDRYDYWGPKPFVRLEKKGDGRSCLTWYMPSIVHDKSTPIRSGSLPPDLITHCVNQLVELMGATWTDNDHAALVVERAINTLPLGDLKSAIDDKETDVEKSLDPGGYETSSGFTFEFGPDTRLPRTWITYDDAEGVSVRLEASSVRRATIPNPGEGDSKHAYSQMREYELERLATQLLSELYHGMEDIESSTRSARKKLSTKLSTIARERIEDQAKFNTHDLERELSLSEYEGAIGSQAGVISYWTEEGLKLRNGKKVKIQVEFTPSEAYFGSRWTAPNLIVEQSSKAGKLLVVIPSTVHREINDWESADPAPDTVANTEGSKSSFFVIGSGNRLRQRFSKDLVNNLSQVCTTLDTDNLEEASKILQNAHRTFVHENFKPHLHGSATKNQADAGWDERHPFLWTPNDSQLEVEFAGRIEDVGTQGLRSLKKLKSTERSSKPQVPSGPHDVYRPLSSSVTPYGNETLEKVAADTKLLCGDGSGGKGSRQSVTTNEQVTPRSQPPQ